jgi:hypothetical protein
MNQPSPWTATDTVYLNHLRKEIKECKANQKGWVVGFLISVVVIAKAPILGGVGCAISFFAHKHFANKIFDHRKAGRDFLLSKGVDINDPFNPSLGDFLDRE